MSSNDADGRIAFGAVRKFELRERAGREQCPESLRRADGFRVARCAEGAPRGPGRVRGRGNPAVAGAGRQRALLRSPAGVRQDRLRGRRNTATGVGGTARGDVPARGRGRLVAVRPAEGGRWQRWLEARHGGDPRAPRAQGAGAAQRPAERVLGGRQLPVRPHVPRLRNSGAARGVRRGRHHAAQATWLRSDRTGARQRRDVAGHQGRPGR